MRTYAPGTADKAILSLAAKERRIVLTLDKDFHQLSRAASLSASYGVILFRVHPAVPGKIIPVMLKTLGLELDWVNHFSVVSETAVQMMPLRRARQ